MYYIGIDLGTSAVKLILMEADGKILNSVSKEYPIYFPHPGWSEQKPGDWMVAVYEGLQELTDGFDAKEVAGISFGGQMHGLVVLDENDHVIRPAILWNDGRTGKQTDYLNQRLTELEKYADESNQDFVVHGKLIKLIPQIGILLGSTLTGNLYHVSSDNHGILYVT